jgi:hypothetical protein
MSRSGRFVAMAQRDAEPVHVTLIDALGTAPRRRLGATGLADFTCVGEALWLVAGDALRRHPLAGGSELAPLALAGVDDASAGPGRLRAACLGQAALWLGQQSLLIREAEDGALDALDVAGDIGSSTCVGVLGGARLALADGPLLRLCDVGQGEVMRTHLPLSDSEPGEVLDCRYLFGERALAVLVAGADAACILVLRPDGALVHRVEVPRVTVWAVAENRGRAVLYRALAGAARTGAPALQPGRLLSVDLRYGRLLARVDAPLVVADLAVDADARYLVVAGQRPAGLDVDPGDENDGAEDGREPDATGDTTDDVADHAAGEATVGRPAIVHLAYARIFGGARGQPRRDLAAGASLPGPRPGDSGEPSEPGVAGSEPDRAGEPGAETGDTSEPGATGADTAMSDGEPDSEFDAGSAAAPRVDAAASMAVPGAAPAHGNEPGQPVGPVYIPPGPLLGLGPPRRLPQVKNPPRVRPYRSADEYLESMLDLVAAQATRAVADAWDRGELSLPSAGQWPSEHAVVGLMGARPGFAAEFLESVTAELGQLARETSERMLATVARGRGLPLVELGMELGLSALHSQVLLVVAAPALRGEIARLYRILAADARRLPCDVHLVERILGGRDWKRRSEITDALAPEGKLVRTGVILREADRGLGVARLTVDPAVVARVRGTAVPGFALRHADRALEALWAPDDVKRALVLALAEPPRDGTAMRVLLRGRRGSGRRTLAAALAARIGRPIADIDCAYLPRPGTAMAEALHTSLCRAVIGGAVPCVSGLEVLGADDAEGIAHVRAVLRAHPAPVLLRASPDLMPPVDPGYVEVTLPPLDETQRLAFWDETLERHGLRADDAALLAARFRVGPGSIEAAARTVAGQRAPGSEPGADADAGAGADGDAAASAGAGGDAGAGADAGDDATGALDTALRQHIESRMGANATRITRLAEWSQVTLPDELRESVLELIARVRQRRTVFEHWGFDRKIQSARGLSALFFGPPGVGKTMVAGVIARDLGLDLYRVDLAHITSKWIGETEKNLSEVFEAGEDGQVIILFDEADSLFAKRTEVKSSVDRHANQQVNYLLQRLDTFEGVALLTTNREGSIDKAFKRRMTMRLAFPFPDEDMRARLWEAHLPADIPRAGTFDLAELARRFPLSGGYIRNCALRAAFLAAAEGVPLSFAHLVRAVELEYHEMGKLAPSGRLE